MTNILSFFLIFSFFLPFCSEAEDPVIQFDFWDKVTGDLNKDSVSEDTITNHSEVKYQFSPHAPFKLGLEIDSFYMRSDLAGANDFTEIRPYETYYNYSFTTGDLRVGYQIVRWGKTDEISPFDIITAEDFRDGFVRPRAQRKIATPLIVLNKSFEESELQILSKPFFTADRYDFSDTDWAILGNQRGGQEPDVDIQSPNYSLKSLSFGARYSTLVHDTNVSLAAYSGPSSSPVLSFNPQNTNTSRELGVFEAQYRRTSFIGTELERLIGSAVLRADLLYSFNEYNTGWDLLTSKSDIFKAVVGIERIFDNDLFLNLQIAEFYRTENYAGTFPRNMEGLFAYLNYPLIENEIRIGSRAFYNITNSSSYVNAYSIFHDRGNWSIESGVDLMFGDFTLFNIQSGRNDQGYLILKIKI